MDMEDTATVENDKKSAKSSARANLTDQVWKPTVEGVRSVLARVRRDAAANSFSNPILMTAVELDDQHLTAKDNLPQLNETVQALTLEAFEVRATRLRTYMGEVDMAANRRMMRALIDKLALDAEGNARPFGAFRTDVERVFYGFVFTAHPTFTLSDELQVDLLTLATGCDADGRPLKEAARKKLLARVKAAQHRPDEPMTLMREHEKAAIAIDNLQAAVRILLEETAVSAREHYPDEWHTLRPRLISVATWVGYDLDGRSDIGWTASFERRMASAATAIGRYRAMIAEILPLASSKPSLAAMIQLTDTKLALAQRTLAAERDQLLRYGAEPAQEEALLAAINRQMLESIDDRLCDARQLMAMIDNAMDEAVGTPALEPLWVLAAMVGINGLADARTHVRINAVQLHNAVRKAVRLDHAPDDPAHRLSYLEAISKKLEDVKPETIHLGSVAHERATAKRVFANIKLLLRFVDGSEPVRFLIAETETAFTLLTALYFAKMFGVDEQVDISPLFETRLALERGINIIEDAIANPSYRAYIRKRGRICIQTGFSDAGRYLGQTAASNAIERIRLGLVDLMVKNGLGDIEVVIFDTHGESIGRGTHPGGFADRFAYYNTDEARRRYARAGVRLCQESSFQGGDGYIYYMNVAGALAAITRVLEHVLTPPSDEVDPFYERSAYVDEFFAAVSSFNASIIDDPCYATLLDAFGQNLTYRSGSRAVKRQFDGRGPMVGLQHPSQIRAIPHNSILQQLGILANTIGGLGFAIDRDPETFQELYRESDRFRRLMAMVEHAFKYTDLTVVRAYVDLFDPGFWLLRAQTGDPQTAEDMMAISLHMEEINAHEKLVRIIRRLMRDHMHLAAALREHRRRTRDEGEQPIVIERKVRDTMHMFHSLRLAVILSLFHRAVQVPHFSDRHDTTHGDAVSHLMHLDVLPTVDLLKTVFPLIDLGSGDHDYGEAVTYESSRSQSYAYEHDQIFNPLAEDYAIIRRIGMGLTHFVGSHG